MEEIIFADTDITAMKQSAKILIEKAMGRKISDADPIWLFCCSLLSIIVQQKVIINHAANQNLLAFATGKNLEALGQLVGVKRLQASAAFCTVEVTLSAVRNKETVIKKGTRVNAGDNVHFALDDDVIFLAGEISKTCHAVCQQEGAVGNGYKIGEISKTVDPQPYLSKIINITESTGGADIESDDDLRERIRIAPSSFSVAGSRQAYTFYAKTASNLVADVYCDSPEPGKVDLYILLDGGQIPNDEILNLVYETVSDEKVRPLTDFCRVFPADTSLYNIDVDYFISRENQTQALAIKNAVEKSVEDFILYQKSKLGRDILPSELIARMRNAGADRIDLREPIFTEIPPNAVALPNNISINYRGLKSP